MCFEVLRFFVILVDPLGSIWCSSGKSKRQIKAAFSPEASRRVPGRDSGSIFGEFKRYLGCIFGTVSLSGAKSENGVLA